MNDDLDWFLSTFLWPDEDWLERDTASCTYWQARLPQHIAVRDLGDGQVRWQVDTVVVIDVVEDVLARELCMELNRFTADWSFAYAPDRTIHALCALTAPASWDRYLLRLAQAAKLSAWFADRIATRLASRLGGIPAFSHPAHQDGLRSVPDAVYALMDVVRERPEWVFDPTPLMFPDPTSLAAFFAEQMGAPIEDTEVIDSDVWIATPTVDGAAMSHIVHSGFGWSPVFGTVWDSDVLFPATATLAAPDAVDSLTWQMFTSPSTTLLGAWTVDDSALVYRQSTLAGTIRSLEQLPTYLGRDAQLLWGITATLSDAIATFVPAADGIAAMQRSPRIARDIRERQARQVLTAVRGDDRAVVDTIPTPPTENADRRLLWLPRRTTVLTCAWFNPMGPTLSTLDVCGDPTGAGQYLVYFMRHPFAPRYQVLADLAVDADLGEILGEAVQVVLDGSVPTMLSLDGCPDDLVDLLQRQVRARITALSRDTDGDLAVQAGLLAVTRGRPWESISPSDETRQQARRVTASVTDAYDAWLQQAAHPDHVGSVLAEFPEPWDGALNYQQSLGNVERGFFDIGPLFVTYSRIGTLSPEELKEAAHDH